MGSKYFKVICFYVNQQRVGKMNHKYSNFELTSDQYKIKEVIS